jgi:PAS domain S-box-containing protein
VLDCGLEDGAETPHMTKRDAEEREPAEKVLFDEREQTERLAFLKLTPREIALLKSLAPVVEREADAFVKAFYDHLLQFEEPRKLLMEEGLRDRLLSTQRSYLKSLFAGEYGREYYENRLRIGFAHDRFRLSPKWYLGAYVIYGEFLHPLIRRHFASAGDDAEAAILALDKILNLDMQLAMEAYIHSSNERLGAANEELERLNLELEDRIAHRTWELAASEIRYRSAIEMSPNLIYQVEANGRFEQLNRRTLERLDYSQEELAERTHDFIVAEDKREAYLRETARVRETGSSRFETHLATRDGERVEVEAYAVLVDPGRPGSPIRLYLQDVTERNRMHRQVQATQKLAAVGRLSSVLAHEVRNPLNAMGLHLTLLERRAGEGGAESREKTLRAIASIRSEVDRLEDLVSDFLRLSRPSEIRRSPSDLHGLIEDVLELEQPRADRLGVRFARVYEKKLPLLSVDGDKLKQAMLNLVSNALDAMPDGGTLTVSTRRTDGKARIDFSDTGRGIPKGMNVFELFFTTKSRGTGMGLNIVEGIIQQHGGHLDFESEEGKGATFSLEVPLDVAERRRK